LTPINVTINIDERRINTDQRNSNAISPLSSLPGLQFLDLSFCTGVTDMLRLAAVAPARGLPWRELRLAGCAQITNTGVMGLVCERCPMLRSLDVRWCPLVTSVAIAAVVEECPLIEEMRPEGPY